MLQLRGNPLREQGALGANPEYEQSIEIVVILRNLQVGGSSADLKVSRHGEEVSLAVLRTRGPIQAAVIQSS